eukprot:TRINITY_DN3210_c0_g5_i1.p1 TRINITY_DN3210_c0_g5~~TRINITY_DN3210_c0_g5_i1.p1  ORF type:complete len:293 (-),score=73.37 TRINITY_DN3210_c0_g5_i1:171-1049(-)
MRTLESQYQVTTLHYFQSWAFFKHINALNLGAMESSKLRLLRGWSSDFRSAIKFIDNECSPRMSVKVGVIYVKKEQYDQKSILFNIAGSAKYEQLLQTLGKPLKRRRYHKCLALQPDILYHATAIHELVFHVNTRMPTLLDDDQQVDKKKYIGNDSVHIVWNENDREYRPGTITGALNFVHLVVHPLRNGLYRIKVERKKEESKKESKPVKFFGPLLTGMVVPMGILPILLRYTAINARRSITFKSLQMHNLLGERKKTLGKVIAESAIKHDARLEEEFEFIDKFIRMGMPD